ncbi:hypothetical protein DEAC_c14010 [Desulfosporosinus acididurans]|uniref:Uncharacterized protein n=1 Tax=Desulfosporosinus acididurans TaxID=476652 RepID=A0A0J1FUQ8_9FIRM|nr:hypothetical protein [Desulfosporosinus acididurans]KLU66733.1 hypothetical protein DEAC_c14010 [Desulfosporosinus acididurans]
MRIDTYYQCPVCQKAWETESKAIICRNQHPAIKKQWYTCGVCGAGWNPDAHWGEKGAAKQARTCEQKHQKKGEVEEVSRQTFFLSGGLQGKYYP